METIIPLDDCCSARFPTRRTYLADTWVRHPTNRSLNASICCPSFRLTLAKVTRRTVVWFSCPLDGLPRLVYLKRQQDSVKAAWIGIHGDIGTSPTYLAVLATRPSCPTTATARHPRKSNVGRYCRSTNLSG